MELNEYQNKCNRKKALGMCYKSGAIANQLKKTLRGDPGKELDKQKAGLAKELGGCFWYMSMLALEIGEIALLNLKEIDDRLERGTLRGDGDNR